MTSHCEVPNCVSPILHGNLCKKHYHRIWHEKRRKGKDITLEELGQLKIVDRPRKGSWGGTIPGTKCKPLLGGQGKGKLEKAMEQKQYPPGRILTEDDMKEAGITHAQGNENIDRVLPYAATPLKVSRRQAANASRRKTIMDAMVVMSDMLKVWIEELKEMDQ